jgi:hypothetical protein
MANPDKPHGFRPLSSTSGEPNRTNEYNVAAANSIIGIGDLLVLTTAGTVDRAAVSATQIIGVAAQAKAASAGGTILVYDDPDIRLEAQTDDGTGTGTDAADLFGNFDIVVTDATNDQSNMEIDESSGSATATLPLKTIALYPDVENEHGEFNRLICIINNHVLKSTGVTGLA